MDSIRVQVDGADSPIKRRIVILASGGHIDDLRFNILRDDSHLLEREVVVGESGQGRRGRDHERRGTGNAGARRRLRVRLNQQAFFGCKKLQQPRGQRQAEATPTPQFLEARERFFPPRVNRAQLNALPLQRRNAASGQDVNRKVKRQRSGVKHIKRPQVDRSAG